MSEIHVKENESLDAALKRFKRSCAKAGVLADLRKKEYYQSPSVQNTIEITGGYGLEQCLCQPFRRRRAHL